MQKQHKIFYFIGPQNVFFNLNLLTLPIRTIKLTKQ